VEKDADKAKKKVEDAAAKAAVRFSFSLIAISSLSSHLIHPYLLIPSHPISFLLIPSHLVLPIHTFSSHLILCQFSITHLTSPSLVCLHFQFSIPF